MNYFRINLILIIVAFLGVNRNFLEGISLVFLIGYIEALHSPSFFGADLVIYLIIFSIVNYISHQMYIVGLSMNVILVGSIVLAVKILDIAVVLLFKDFSVLSLLWIALIEIFCEGFATIIFSVVIFAFFKFIDAKTGVKREKTGFFSGPVYLHRA